MNFSDINELIKEMDEWQKELNDLKKEMDILRNNGGYFNEIAKVMDDMLKGHEEISNAINNNYFI